VKLVVRTKAKKLRADTSAAVLELQKQFVAGGQSRRKARRESRRLVADQLRYLRRIADARKRMPLVRTLNTADDERWINLADLKLALQNDGLLASCEDIFALASKLESAGSHRPMKDALAYAIAHSIRDL